MAGDHGKFSTKVTLEIGGYCVLISLSLLVRALGKWNAVLVPSLPVMLDDAALHLQGEQALTVGKDQEVDFNIDQSIFKIAGEKVNEWKTV
jgi:hypothetical protein